ncbi:MAG: hypothetical protein JO120_01780, partial [Solirubrobacterales bacterium]|nr:hypothetical protein [Solirubrobacterales bacterium]
PTAQALVAEVAATPSNQEEPGGGWGFPALVAARVAPAQISTAATRPSATLNR